MEPCHAIPCLEPGASPATIPIKHVGYKMTTFNSTEQPVIWFRDRYLAGELVLKPPFQRQPVWTAKQKSHLIESILLGLPIPEIYIQHSVETVDGEERSVYAI